MQLEEMGHERILLQQFPPFPPNLAEHYQLHLETHKDQVQPLTEVPWALALPTQTNSM